jgi:hypothetical protein
MTLMPSWNEVLQEILVEQEKQVVGPIDVVRRRYLARLHQHTGRNVICYYSGWLQKPGYTLSSVNDDDKNGLMNAVYQMDRSKGLDLVLHTPGGNIAATESIVHYLRQMFGINIRAIIPQMAMSAGTMIACACKELVMGKQSNIGPFDPQFGGIPAYGVLEEFQTAIDSVKADPGSIPIWQAIISKYHPTFIGECQNAIQHAADIVNSWLITGMFHADADAVRKAEMIVTALNDHAGTKTHERHLHVEDAVGLGLKVIPLESDQVLQDLVLTVHHAYMHTFANTNAGKMIENHSGAAILHYAPVP